MSLKDKTAMANMKEEELINLDPTLGEYIRNQFGLWSGNEDLMASCRMVGRKNHIRREEASGLIIAKLWGKLNNTHVIRVIK
jgi:hypothetical protein